MRDALVGADSIRPNVTGVSCPLNGTARSALGSTSGGAGSPNGLAEGVRYEIWKHYKNTHDTLSAPVRALEHLSQRERQGRFAPQMPISWAGESKSAV